MANTDNLIPAKFASNQDQMPPSSITSFASAQTKGSAERFACMMRVPRAFFV